jgi:hypothetical protein
MEHGPNITVVNVAISIIVPLVSVVAAQQFTERRALRDSARQAFVDLIRHLQAFRSALIKLNFSKWWQLHPDSRDKVFTDLIMQPFLEGQGILTELTEAHIQLAADMLLLQLLFGAKATKLTTAISEVLSLQKDVKPATVETAEAHVQRCEERIMAQFKMAMDEVAALWNPLENPLERV